MAVISELKLCSVTNSVRMTFCTVVELRKVTTLPQPSIECVRVLDPNLIRDESVCRWKELLFARSAQVVTCRVTTFFVVTRLRYGAM